MITYNFTNTGSDSLYVFLYKCIKNDIIQGKISAGEKLPSKRTFAKNLGISVITVENAYEQLKAEGYIYSMPKRGFFAADLNDRTAPVQTAEKGSGLPAGIPNSYLADFSGNQTDSEVFPFTIWSKTVREVLNDSRIQLMTNPPCGGIMELRTAVSQYLKEFRGMDVKPEHIIVGAGTEYLFGLLIQLLGTQLTYGLENPGYRKTARIYESMKVPYEAVPIDERGVSVSELENRKVDIIHISPSHHFPTGIVMPVSRRYELLGWAAGKEQRYIIEDDYDSELRLSGKQIPTLQSIDVADKVIYINTFTKTLASTVRISYMVLPETLAQKFYERLSFYSCTVSNFEQYTLARFIENGSFEKHINRLRNYYQNKKNQILQGFRQSRLGDYITITGEEAGAHFLMQVKTVKKDEEIVSQARTKGIRLAPLFDYYENAADANAEHAYVMNYSSVDVELVDKIANQLYEIIS